MTIINDDAKVLKLAIHWASLLIEFIHLINLINNNNKPNLITLVQCLKVLYYKKKKTLDHRRHDAIYSARRIYMLHICLWTLYSSWFVYRGATHGVYREGKILNKKKKIKISTPKERERSS